MIFVSSVTTSLKRVTRMKRVRNPGILATLALWSASVMFYNRWVACAHISLSAAIVI